MAPEGQASSQGGLPSKEQAGGPTWEQTYGIQTGLDSSSDSSCRTQIQASPPVASLHAATHAPHAKHASASTRNAGPASLSPPHLAEQRLEGRVAGYGVEGAGRGVVCVRPRDGRPPVRDVHDPGGIMWVTLALILSEPWGVSTITGSPSLIPLAAASRGLILARGSGSISLSQGSSLCLLWV
jgi:hypothetical protein